MIETVKSNWRKFFWYLAFFAYINTRLNTKLYTTYLYEVLVSSYMTCPRKISLLELCLLNNMIIIFIIFCQKSATQVADWAIANPEGQVAYYLCASKSYSWMSIIFRIAIIWKSCSWTYFCYGSVLPSHLNFFNLEVVRNLSDSEFHFGFSKLLAYSMSLDWNLVRSSTTTIQIFSFTIS